MNSDEIKNEFNLASYQYDIRVARLKRLYQTQVCPPEILEHEKRLVDEAGNRLRTYGLPYNELISKLPEIQGEKILKETMQNIQFDEMQDELEERWLEIKTKYAEKYPGNEHLIDDLISELRDNPRLM